MPVKVYKDAMSLRPRSKPLPVVVSADDPDLGVVTVTVCEIPAGLFEELEGEAKELAEELREKNRAIAASRRRAFELEDVLAAGAWPSTEGAEPKAFEAPAIRAELAELAARVAEIKAERRELRTAKNRKLLELIAWGICDHQAEDFLTGDEPQPFEAAGAGYDGLTYRIAGPDTIRQYASVGQSFIDSLYTVVTNYQRQIVLKPAEVWAEAKKAKELLEKAFAAAMKGQIERAVKDATGKDTAEELAELGAEEPDPNEKRPA